MQVPTYHAPMARSAAATVDEYLAELPDDRAEVVQAVRDVVLANLPAGYVEAVGRALAATPPERMIELYERARA